MGSMAETGLEASHDGELHAPLSSDANGHVNHPAQAMPLVPLPTVTGMPQAATVPGPVMSPTGLMSSSRGNSVASISTAPLPPPPRPGPPTVGNVSIHHPHQPSHSHGHTHPHSQGQQHPISLPPPQNVSNLKGVWNGYLAQADAARPFPGYQPLFDWPAGSQNGMPSAVLTTCADGSLTIEAPPPMQPVNMDSGSTQFWNDLGDDFPSTSGQPLPPAFNAASRVLFLNRDRPMRQGVSLAEIYARVVESWFVGLPAHTREYARARILALNDSNSESITNISASSVLGI